MLYIIYYETELFDQYIGFLLDFCSNNKEEDIICVVKNKNYLHEKIHRYYYSYRISILFNKKIPNDEDTPRFFQKWVYDTWNEHMIQTDMFIGPSKMIYDFWKNIEPNENAHVYAMKKIKNQRSSSVLDFKYSVDDESNIFKHIKIKDGEMKKYIQGNNPLYIQLLFFQILFIVITCQIYICLL
jgi:hypothetical protein